MKLLIVLSALIVVAAAQFGGFRQNSFNRNNQRSFLRFDDDFDDFDDDDSLEDLYEDLYDDDADDRAEARAKLTRLRASGAITGNAFRNNRRPSNNAFRSTGFNNNGFVNRFSNNNQRNNFRTSFNTPRPFVNTFSANRNNFNNNNNFNRNGFSSNSGFSSNTGFPSNTGFSSFQSNNNRFNNGGFQSSSNRFSGPNSSGFGQPLFSTNTVNTNNGFTNKRSSNSAFNNKQNSAFSSLNSIRPSGISKSTSPSGIKTLPKGINWPGGNGYFFSMSSNGAAPVSYFISYDD